MTALKAAKPVVAFATDEPRDVVFFPARDIESSTQLHHRQQAFVARRYRVRPEIAAVVAAFAFGEARP